MAILKTVNEAVMQAFEVTDELQPIAKNHDDTIYGQLAAQISTNQTYAESGTRRETETDWSDEYKIYIGQQWDTTRGLRGSEAKENNLNSQDNLILPTIENIVASLTTSDPQAEIDPMESGDADLSRLLMDFFPALLAKNKFMFTFRKQVRQCIKHGPLIAMVDWDGAWIGGRGENRWIGDCRILAIKKTEFYPDPAIIDLEERLQECSFIHLKYRMKLQDVVERWPTTGQKLGETSASNGTNEGANPDQTDIIESWSRGTPDIISPEYKKKFLELASKALEAGLPVQAKDYKDMANGTLKGVHVAYTCEDRILEYIPYKFDHGRYPFLFKVLYEDELRPMGMGEIRNLITPQILHNLADEIEIGGMASEGLGGGWYDKDAIDEGQLANIAAHNAKPGIYNEVNDIGGIKERTGGHYPVAITNYKEHKQKMIDTISQNTAIQQGISPGSTVPYASIQELGARGDIRTKAKIEIIEDFLVEMYQMVIEVVGQFYTDKRMFRIVKERSEQAKAAQIFSILKQISNMPQGTDPALQMQALTDLLTVVKTEEPRKTDYIGRADLVRSWTRDSMSGDGVKEEFIPEFDIKVRVGDEKPSDRNYYTNIALKLFGSAMGINALWKTLDEGKFPPVDEILQEVTIMKQQQAAMQQQSTTTPGR